MSCDWLPGASRAHNDAVSLTLTGSLEEHEADDQPEGVSHNLAIKPWHYPFGPSERMSSAALAATARI